MHVSPPISSRRARAGVVEPRTWQVHRREEVSCCLEVGRALYSIPWALERGCFPRCCACCELLGARRLRRRCRSQQRAGGLSDSRAASLGTAQADVAGRLWCRHGLFGFCFAAIAAAAAAAAAAARAIAAASCRRSCERCRYERMQRVCGRYLLLSAALTTADR